MASPSTFRHRRSKSPQFSDTVEKNLFMRNVINSNPNGRNKIPKEKELSVRRSLEEISKDIKGIEDFLTVTENIIKRERERDKEFYARERRRRAEEKKRKSLECPNKENKTPSPPKKSPASSRRNSQKSPTFKINSFKVKKGRIGSPKFYNSKLYFRNGKIGCVGADQDASNIECTHALVKHILKFENEKPLVSPENVEKVLKQNANTEEIVVEDLEVYSASEDKRETEVKNVEVTPEDTADSSSQPVEAETEVVSMKYSEPAEVGNEETANIREEIDEKKVVSDRDDETINKDEAASVDKENEEFVRERVRHLVRRFTTRTKKMRSRLDLPPTPSSSMSSPSPPPVQGALRSQIPLKNQIVKVAPSYTMHG